MKKLSTTSLLTLLAAGIVFLLSGSEALATYYKYVDGSGAVVITNEKDSVPAKYRKQMKVIKDETLEKKDRGARAAVPQSDPPEESVEEALPADAATAQAPAAPQGRFAELCARYAWFKPLVYVAGFFVALFAVIKVTTLLPSPQLVKVVYIAFFLGVGVFVYKSYVDSVANSYSSIKNQSMQMMKNSTKRESTQLGEGGAPADPTAAVMQGSSKP